MGIISTEAEVKVNSFNVEYYKSLGYQIPMKKASESYFKRYGKEYIYDFSKVIIVKIEDLQEGSHALVHVECDMCKNNEMDVQFEVYNRVVKKTGSYVCKECSAKKRQKTTVKRYGKPFALQSSEIRERMCQTSLERYGVRNYCETKECREKMIKTSLQRYGAAHPMQSQEVREKANKTLCKNGTQKISKQQLYLHSIYGGEINYPISYYSVDICIPTEKLVIEYDGGGHDLRVILGILTPKEFNQKEIVRNNIIKKEGYKQMRIVSTKDFLPSDVMLLQMLSQAKEYFSNYPNHSWIEYNIDTSTVRNAEKKDGVFFDYGELRRIKASSKVA